MTISTKREDVERLALSLRIADQPLTATTLEALLAEHDALEAHLTAAEKAAGHFAALSAPLCSTIATIVAERDAAQTEVKRLREALDYYADTFCELGTAEEACGKLDTEHCSGCCARAALTGEPRHDR